MAPVSISPLKFIREIESVLFSDSRKRLDKLVPTLLGLLVIDRI